MKKYLCWLLVLFSGISAVAHPMPSSIVDLSVLDQVVKGEAKIPLVELGNAVGDQRITNMADPFFKTYFTEHIKATSAGDKWSTQVDDISLLTGQDQFIGTYKEVIVRFTLTPKNTSDLRRFTFDYDAVIHQVITHSALIYVRQDWTNGIQAENDAKQIGVIKLDIPTEKIFPLEVNLEEGSWWKGFEGMIKLGTQHIKEGTDHLLFLLVLLLPAMLLPMQKSWGEFGGTKYSLIHLAKIVTSFTIGHSITLLVGAIGWIKLPVQAVEISIAISILVSAVHAVYPVFAGKENYVAAGFGLIHGLAFATVLSNLDLNTTALALSIFGFNLGIELMQLFIIALTIPWLILLSKTPYYKLFRIATAIFASVAAMAWITERITAKANMITAFLGNITEYGPWTIAAIAVVSLITYLACRNKQEITAYCT